MEVFAHYFSLAFLAIAMFLPIAAILFLSAKASLRKDPNNRAMQNRIHFSKKLMIFSGAFIVIYFIVYYLFLQDVPSLKYKTDSEFANGELAPFMQHELPNDSCEIAFQTQALQFLKTRHQDKIYFSNFKFDKADSIELSFILYYIEHPKLSDSAKLVLRNKVKSTGDLKKYLTK